MLCEDSQFAWWWRQHIGGDGGIVNNEIARMQMAAKKFTLAAFILYVLPLGIQLGSEATGKPVNDEWVPSPRRKHVDMADLEKYITRLSN